MSDNVRVRKVRAFPFEAELSSEGTPPLKVQIVKMSPIGFLIETAASHYNVGDKLHFHFELPAMHRQITGEGIVVKAYNHFTLATAAEATTAALRLLEVHFRSMSTENRDYVTAFLRKAIKPAS